MTKKVLLLAMAVVACGGATEAVVLRRTDAQLAESQRRLSDLESLAERTRLQRAARTASIPQAQQALDTARAKVAADQALAAQANQWWQRIQHLQARFAEIPAARFPEIKLLGMKDWIDAVLASETATEDQIQSVVAGLRNRARLRFAAMLPDALKRYSTASGGALPSAIDELLPYLPAPGNAEMLSHYTMTRTGQIGAVDEDVIAMKAPFGDWRIAVSLDGYHVTGKVGAEISGTETNGATPTREDLANAMNQVRLSAPSSDSDELTSDSSVIPFDIGKVMEMLGSELETELGSLDQTVGEDFGDRLKVGIRQYIAEHAGKPPEDLSQLITSVSEFGRLVERLRPLIAKFEYFFDHHVGPNDAAALQPYLDHNTDARILRRFKLTVDGDHGSLQFKMGTPGE